MCYLNVSFGRSIDQLPRLGKRELGFLLSITRFVVVSVRRSSSSSGCLGKAALVYCAIPLAFHVKISYSRLNKILYELIVFFR